MSAATCLFGVLGLLVAFITNTAPEGTHNLGLLQHQMIALTSVLRC